MSNPWIIAIVAGIIPFLLQKIWDLAFSTKASVVGIVHFNKFKEPPDLKEKMVQNSLYRFPAEMMQIKILNKGKKIAKSLELNIPDAYIATKDELQIPVTNNRISIGDVLPKQSIEVFVWARWPYFESISKSISLTYENGIGIVLLEKRYIQSRLKKFVRKNSIPLFFATIYLLWGLTIYLGVKKIS